MDAYIEGLSYKEWEKFCAMMLRHHYTPNNFWEVPDQDQGDSGLEFFAIDGTIFQCYYPDKNANMASYKTKVQKKIRDDLGKLKKYEKDILSLLGGITISRWVLLMPEMKSRKLIEYCNKKRNELLSNPPCYIDIANFQVKIDTPESYPAGTVFAKSLHNKPITISMPDVTDDDSEVWKQNNSEFSDNIARKSDLLMNEKPEKSAGFKKRVMIKYIQLERFLDELRSDYPDVHEQLEDSARARLEQMQNQLFLADLDSDFLNSVLAENSDAFYKYSEYLSDSNFKPLSFGYVSKWLAECYMDFEYV